MHNSDMRCGGDGDSGVIIEDRQVELCFKLMKKLENIDRLIARGWWEAVPEDRNISAIARRYSLTWSKVDNRITWIEDEVIRECVKKVNIYA